MRLSLLATLFVVLSAQTTLAAKSSSKTKSYTKMCKEENPGATKTVIKTCVKNKKMEDKNK